MRESHGALAQLVERRLCKPNVRGSNPLCSTMKNRAGLETNLLFYLMEALFAFERYSMRMFCIEGIEFYSPSISKVSFPTAFLVAASPSVFWQRKQTAVY